MSSATRKFRVIDGKVQEVTERPVEVRKTYGYSEDKPGKSIGMSCHSSQVDERNALMKKHGIQGVEFVHGKKVNCQITSRSGRRAAMKLFGYHDNDGGYGDG